MVTWLHISTEVVGEKMEGEQSDDMGSAFLVNVKQLISLWIEKPNLSNLSYSHISVVNVFAD